MSDACVGLEGEQVHGLAAVAESEDKHASAPVPAAVWIAEHRAGAVIHLRLLAGRGDDGEPAPSDGPRSAGTTAGGVTKLCPKAGDVLLHALGSSEPANHLAGLSLALHKWTPQQVSSE